MAHLRKTLWTIDVFDLMHRPGEMREREISVPAPEILGNAVIGVAESEPVHLDLRMESLHDGILVSVGVDTVARGECVRCLIDVSQPVEVDIQELFAYSQEDAFEYEVHDDHVDLEPLVRDAVVLSLPFQPVCQEDCLGLCPECGARLLDDPLHAHEKPIDPRWAALAGLESIAEATRPDVDSDAPEASTDKEKR